MTNRPTHVADVKVGKVRGNSRIYPQLRLPSQYAELAGQRASIYEISEQEGNVAFIIRFDGAEAKGVAAYHEQAERAEGHVSAREPCRVSSLMIRLFKSPFTAKIETYNSAFIPCLVTWSLLHAC